MIALGAQLHLERSGLDLGQVTLVPELSIAPQWVLFTSKVDGHAGAPIPESIERWSQIGLWAAAGLVAAAGPGELGVHLSLVGAGLDGTITGDSTAFAFAPMLGYRLVL